MSNSQPRVSYFLDSNIWLYALIKSQDTSKYNIANDLTTATGIPISMQVINEVCVNLIKKAAFNEQQIEELISAFYQIHRIVEPNLSILLEASRLRSNYLISFWDSLIVASALHAGVDILYSEDMQDGLVVFDKLEIINPFK